ncbi:MAG TPA: hypothetical protein VFB13_18335 [Reyranella sp.]|nr:hypothetical protein [Reyranella sp.]
MSAGLKQIALVLALLLAAVAAPAQNASPVQNPAELKAYTSAINTKDAAKRAEALEIFIAWYPNSTLRIDAYEQLMASWQVANNPDKAVAAASKLLQIDPDNLRALANRAYVGRTHAAAGDAAALTQAVAAAEHGFAAIGKWKKPEAMSDSDFGKLKLQVMAIFNGVMGFAALQAKDYAKAKRYYLDAVTVDPDNLQDVYQLSVAELEGRPVDALGFWYAARAIAIARGSKTESAASSIEKYARSRYQRYHGSEEGWEAIVARASGERLPPDNFARSISRLMTPQERAVQLVTDNEPGALSYADWELVLSHRDFSPANKTAAERVWRAIADKQRGGEARLKIPIKVIKASPERIEGAITEANQASNTADLDVAMARPLTPLPAVGAKIAIVGLLSDYRALPFAFVMTGAELAQESMPVAGGPCADPRPKVCTREYRPACGLRRDKTSRTYGNACSACADPEVVTQAAGACPSN